MRNHTRLAVLLTATLALGASAQPTSPTAPPLEPQNNRIIQAGKQKRWTVKTTITLTAYGDVDRRVRKNQDGTQTRDDRVSQDTWVFDDMMVMFPVMVSSASSFRPNDKVGGSLTIEDVVVDTDPTITTPYQSQAIYARWDAPRGVGHSMRLIQTQDLVSYETKYDEKAAVELEWPDEWPPEAASTFAAQQFVNGSNPEEMKNDPDLIDRLLETWTEGQDPKSIKPAVLAKWLAGRVQEHVSIVRSSTTNRRSSDVTLRNTTNYTPDDDEISSAPGISSGFDVQNAYLTAKDAKGTKHDMAVLLTAIYRRAGLPARIVIGYSKFDRKRKGKRAKQSDRVRSWVEFALLDSGDTDAADDDVLVWVPVDVAAMRGRSSRAGDMDRPWKYFGANKELDLVVPLAFHFHPPTEVRSYAAPALYGWTMSPAPPQLADQYISIEMSGTPSRGDD